MFHRHLHFVITPCCLLVLALSCATAHAQRVAEVDIANGDPGLVAWPTEADTAGSLQSLCARAARAPWAVESGRGYTARCELVETRDARLAFFVVDFARGLRAYLARRHGDELELVALVDDVVDAPAGHESSGFRLVRMRRERRASVSVLFLETETTHVDAGARDAVRTLRRSLTICSERAAEGLRCASSVPLRTQFEVYEEDFARADHLAVHEATAHLRRDGQVRLSLVRGSWDGLLDPFSSGGVELRAATLLVPVLDADGRARVPLDVALGGLDYCVVDGGCTTGRCESSLCR